MKPRRDLVLAAFQRISDLMNMPCAEDAELGRVCEYCVLDQKTLKILRDALEIDQAPMAPLTPQRGN